MSYLSNEFQKAMEDTAPIPIREEVVQNTQIISPWTTCWQYIITHSWVWGILTFFFFLLFFYSLRPPLVQYPVNEEEPLVMPKVQLKLVLIWSIIPAILVALSPYLSRYFFLSSTS